MLYEIYNATKQQLTTADTQAVIKGIEWYNVQYESTITNTPRVFVEFTEAIPFSQANKQLRRGALKMRLHVVTNALSLTDGTVPDTLAQTHEATATLVMNAIEGFKPLLGGVALTSTMHLSAWQHWHKYRGWMVTFIEFDCVKTL